MPTIKLHVQSEIHEDDEYGARVNQNGKHSGGPFVIQVSPKMTVEDLRLEIKVSAPLILSLCLRQSWVAKLHYTRAPLASPILAGQGRDHPRHAEARLRWKEAGRSEENPRAVSLPATHRPGPMSLP